MNGAHPGTDLPVVQVDLGEGVRAGFTTRACGVSRPPYDALNLGTAVGDDPVAVGRNRERLARWAGAPVAYATQVHGARVVLLSDPPGSGASVGEADALVSVSPRVAVAVLVADCVPVLLADAAAGVVAAVHAGRRGLAEGVVQAAVGSMVEQGADVARIRAAIGPSIAGESYEVPAALQDEVAQLVPETRATTAWGTPALDLPAGVDAVLRRTGVRAVSRLGRDTWADPVLFSFRRSPRTGRFAGVVRPPA
ncbi:peptidoglycan editing factor PgeF [Cellulomonas fengjieae]|uniref:Purine nucleoside phosphorylase n=1 Tax=Cellulomonas fengjieae TaxID=2819978 RepID=A0ABS3SEZ0_9CELL|nr:peptidoglycan editing factor PgeF [Cellulomonas fengjieae]MBO3084316.1 peptidoglycan editing factor PgeF [Cellulomonas fengjieae]QVI67334.1 peptidoglycan editing factor PgeF [Cellulomonas fengjieae]